MYGVLGMQRGILSPTPPAKLERIYYILKLNKAKRPITAGLGKVITVMDITLVPFIVIFTLNCL